MSKAIAICGLPGSGKTSSVFPSKELGVQGLDPEKTFFISVQKTELPMRGWKKKFTTFTNKITPTLYTGYTRNAGSLSTDFNKNIVLK